MVDVAVEKEKTG